MLGALFGFPQSKLRRRFPPVLLLNSSLAALLFVALIGWVPVASAQTSLTENMAGVISGHVYLTGKNRPASQVAVTLKSYQSGVFRSVLTNLDGRFEVGGLPQGAYEISVEEAGYEPLHATTNLDGPLVNLELQLTAKPSPSAPRSAYAVSVRELRIPVKALQEFNKGLESLAKKAFAASLQHFAKAAQVFPGYYEALYHQGVAETNLGQLENAMQTFQKSLDLSGGRYARDDFGIGYVLYLQGKAGEAESVIRRGLELDENSPDGYVILGMTLLRQDRPNEAEKSAREALLRNPNLANAYLVLADSFGRRHDYRQQIAGLDAYLRLEPKGPASARAHEVREVAQRILAESQPQN